MRLTSSLELLLSKMEADIDRTHIKPVFHEYLNLEKRFYLGDWSPAEWDAGRFCEALVAPISFLDRGLIPKHTPNQLVSKLTNDDIKHNLSSVDRKNISKILAAVYEIRSSRNSVHLAPEYTADYVDSMFVLSSCKWLLCELVRLSTGQSNHETVRLLRGIVQLGDPVVFEVDGRPILMRTDLSAAQEVLLLLLHRPGYSSTKAELISFADGFHKPGAISTALSRLADKREVVKSPDGRHHLTPLGKATALKLLP